MPWFQLANVEYNCSALESSLDQLWNTSLNFCTYAINIKVIVLLPGSLYIAQNSGYAGVGPDGV